jgi:acylphosphatase
MDVKEMVRATVWVHGRVQGVGFRWWARSRALELGLAGYARNASGGRVEIVAQGPPERVQQYIEMLEEKPSRHLRPGDVHSCVTSIGPPREEEQDFVEK